MNILVRAVITGFGLSLGKLLFDKVKERVLPDDAREPQRVVVVNAGEFADQMAELVSDETE